MTISGFTIVHRFGVAGVGIYCSNSSLRIIGNTIEDNHATSGAGIYCTNSSLTIRDNVITANKADDCGGGIECTASSGPTIADNTIADNSAGDHAGGICCDKSSPVITGNLIEANDGNYNGGGVCCNESSPTITDNTIADNGGMDGGGIYCEGSCTPTITRDSVIGNIAIEGGGVACAASSTPVITDDVIANDTADTSGGGIYLSATGSTVSNDTIADNVASDESGGIYCASGIQPVTNCIIWGNSSVYYGCNLAYCDFPGILALSHNIHADPLFVAPESGDYHLVAGSPCIDDASATAAPATDRDGIARPWGAGFDRGAYEYYVPAYHTSTSLTAPKSVKVKKSLTLSGAVSPTAASPYAPPGKVTITMTRKVGKKWRSAGSAKISLVGGAFTYSLKPKFKGSWHFVAAYSGGVVGPTTYLPSTSAIKGVTVK